MRNKCCPLRLLTSPQCLSTGSALLCSLCPESATILCAHLPTLPATLWICFPVSLKDYLVGTSWDVRRVSGYLLEDDSVSTNTLQSVFSLPYCISGLPLSWGEVCDDPRATTGQDSNFFRSVSSTILFYVWTLIAHDHQVSMRQETLHINCYFTYIWLFVVFPCCISPYCIYKLLEGKLP